MIDRDIYFNAVRPTLFEGALTQQQVDGQNVLLALWEHGDTGTPMDDLRWLAYALATTYWECAQKMWPVIEIGKGAGHDYGIPDPETGETYYARGFVGLTWKSNYDKASAALGLIDDRDLVWHPDLALDSLIAARIMFRGMSEGWFTGKRFSQYFDDDTDDPVGAREIINGHDRDTEIAAFHMQFLAALQEATIDQHELDRPVLVAITIPPGVDMTVTVNGEIL